MKKSLLLIFLLVGLWSVLSLSAVWAQCTPDRSACRLNDEIPICLSPQEVPPGRVGQPYNQTVQILVIRQVTDPESERNLNLTRMDIIETLNLPPGLTVTFRSGNPADRSQDSILAVWTTPRRLPPGDNVGIFGCLTISGTPTEPTDPSDTTQIRIRLYAGIGPLTVPVFEAPFPYPVIIEDDVVEPLKVDAGPDLSVCAGQSVQLNASPCTRGLTYRWSPATGLSSSTGCNPTANPQRTTNYTVTISDGTNTAQDVVTVTVVPSPTLRATTRNISCGKPGNLRLEITGGTVPFTIINQNGVPIVENLRTTTIDFPVEVPGTYILTVMDANGCSTDVEATVDESPGLEVATTTRNISCTAKGNIRLEFAGGTAPYRITLNKAIIAENVRTAFYDYAVERAGSYNLSVTDANGCTSEVVARVIETPNTLRIRSVTIPAGVGSGTGPVRMRASGGTPPYEYSLDAGANYQSSSSFTVRAGTYQPQVKDAGGCTKTMRSLRVR
jgi:hypothetical protein